jgi:NADPH:quinone reductase-like Zn-dependent oxidoreductase
MRAILFDGHGGPEMMRLGEVEPPSPGPGEVLIRTVAAGVNPIDWKIREGRVPLVREFPFVPGSEVAGEVVGAGPDVTGFAPSDRVCGMTRLGGGYADMVVIDAARLAHVPAAMAMTVAAALPVAVTTVDAVLAAADLGAGKRILVHAAAGGVGTLLLQFARLQGGDVTAMGSPGNLAFLRDLGADHVVDRTAPLPAGFGEFDVVVDAFGGDMQENSWPLLRRGGLLISLVARIDQDAAQAHGVRAVPTVVHPSGAALAKMAQRIAAGEITVPIEQIYPFEDGLAAIAASQAGRGQGKRIIRFAPD